MKLYIIRWSNGQVSHTEVRTKRPTAEKLWMMETCTIIEAEATGVGWWYDKDKRKLVRVKQTMPMAEEDFAEALKALPKE